MKCTECHHTVERRSKFCTNCGAPVEQRSTQPSRPTKAGLPMSYILVLVGLGMVAGYGVFRLTSDSNHRSFVTPAASGKIGIIHSAAVLDIAREFTCFCGNCADPLDTCDCEHPNGGVIVKGFIAGKLRDGHKKPHIVEMVREKYGKLTIIPPKLQFNLE